MVPAHKYSSRAMLWLALLAAALGTADCLQHSKTLLMCPGVPNRHTFANES